MKKKNEKKKRILFCFALCFVNSNGWERKTKSNEKNTHKNNVQPNMCQPKPKFCFAEDGNGEKGSGMRAGELAALTKTMVMLLFLH